MWALDECHVPYPNTAELIVWDREIVGPDDEEAYKLWKLRQWTSARVTLLLSNLISDLPPIGPRHHLCLKFNPKPRNYWWDQAV